MARRQIVVCDVCERIDRPTARYRIWREGARATLELCTEHSRPLEGLLAKVQTDRGRRPRIEDTVTTMDALAQEREQALQTER